MKKTITTVLLGLLLIGTLGAAVVSAVASDDAKANDSFGQVHQWCGKYMGPATSTQAKMEQCTGGVVNT